MKHAMITAIAALVLGACWGAPPNEKILKTACIDVLQGDADIERTLLSDIGTDLDGYCGCYASVTIKFETRTALHKDVLSAMVTARSEGIGAEAAAKAVEAQIENGEIDTFDAEQLDNVGEDFQDIAESLEETGQCPA